MGSEVSQQGKEGAQRRWWAWLQATSTGTTLAAVLLPAHACFDPACQAPPTRLRLAGASTSVASPGKRKQPPGPTWKRRHSTASRHSAEATRGKELEAGAPGLGIASGGMATHRCPDPSLPPPPPRHRPAPRFFVCLTPATARVCFHAAERGNCGALPNHAIPGRGARALSGGGACMPCGGAVRSDALPTCPASRHAQQQTSIRGCDHNTASSVQQLSPFSSPPGVDPRNDFTAHWRHLQRAWQRGMLHGQRQGPGSHAHPGRLPCPCWRLPSPVGFHSPDLPASPASGTKAVGIWE